MNQYEDLLVDALLDRGFNVDEALRLIELQDHFEKERRETEKHGSDAPWISETSSDQSVDD